MSKPVSLRRVLKFRTVVSTSTGLAYTAISLLGCVQLASLVGGDSGWIAIVIAGLLAVLVALCFSELNALYPTAAAIRQYMKEAFNDNFSLTITFGYMLTIITVVAADSYIVAGLCVIQLRRRQPSSERSFRIRGGWTIPILTILIFGILAILASLGIGSNIQAGLPLIITIVIFIVSGLYVFLVVPRLRAAAEARRATTRRRRPPRETSSTEISQG